MLRDRTHPTCLMRQSRQSVGNALLMPRKCASALTVPLKRDGKRLALYWLGGYQPDLSYFLDAVSGSQRTPEIARPLAIDPSWDFISCSFSGRKLSGNDFPVGIRQRRVGSC